MLKYNAKSTGGEKTHGIEDAIEGLSINENIEKVPVSIMTSAANRVIAGEAT